MDDKTSKSLRKKPTQERSQAVVEAISEAATRILKKAGYAKTTTNWVAEKAGVSIGSLYQYFPNKESIVSFLIEKSMLHISKKSSERLFEMEHENYKNANKEFINYTVDLFYSYRQELHAFAKSAPFFNHIDQWNKHRGIFSMQLSGQLKKYSKELKVTDYDVSAYILHNAVMGVMQGYIMDIEREIPKEQMVEELTRLTRNYVIYD